MLRDVMIRLIISAIGIVVSVSAYYVLFIVYNNNDVGFWSALSGILGVICFCLHWKQGKETLKKWSIITLFFVGFISFLVGAGGLIGYMFLTFYYKIPFQPISKSTSIAAIWSLICVNWGIILMYYTNKYSILVQEGTGLILTETT